MSIFSKSKSKRTTLVGIEIAGDKEHKLIVDEVTFNSLGGVPKGHPFIDREFPGAIKAREDSIEKPIDLTKDMNEAELTKYLEREWNRGKYQAGELVSRKHWNEDGSLRE